MVSPRQGTISPKAPPGVRVVALVFLLFAIPSFVVFILQVFQADFSWRTWGALLKGFTFGWIGLSLPKGEDAARGVAVFYVSLLTLASVLLVADFFVSRSASDFAKSALSGAMLAACIAALVVLLRPENKSFFGRN